MLKLLQLCTIFFEVLTGCMFILMLLSMRVPPPMWYGRTKLNDIISGSYGRQGDLPELPVGRADD